MLKSLLFSTVLLVLLTFNSSAQTNKNEKEIISLRQKIMEAINRKDIPNLEKFFMDDYTHTHAIGRIDGKKRRLEGLTDGEQNIDSVLPTEINIRFYNKNTAIVNGKTTTANNGKEMTYQWTAVYIKTKQSWKVAATQGSLVE